MNRVESTTKDSYSGPIGKNGDGLSPGLSEEQERVERRERQMHILRRKLVRLAHGEQYGPQPRSEQI